MIGFHSLAKFFHCIARSVLLCELSELHFTHAAGGRFRREMCVANRAEGIEGVEFAEFWPNAVLPNAATKTARPIMLMLFIPILRCVVPESTLEK
jgi:hypothetical protein